MVSVKATDTASTVMQIISAIASKELSKSINLDSHFKYDLAFDSLNMVELCIAIEGALKTSIESRLSNVNTVRDIVTIIENNGGISDVPYNIDDFPIQKKQKHIRRLKLLMRLSRIAWRFELTGTQNIPTNGRYILCPNHQSHFDSLWVWAAVGSKNVDLKKISCLAKQEHLERKSSVFLLSMLGGIPVDRSGNTAPAMKRALACLQDGHTMLIHPEGTRTLDGKMGEFKGGAAKLAIDAGVDLIPVRIDGAWDIFPPHRKRPKVFRFGGRYPIKISFGALIKPDGKSVEELTAQLQSEVARMEHTE